MKELKNQFIELFSNEPTAHFSCGGRFEILGNHTDHNHGLCLAATCSLAIDALVSKNNDNVVRIVSKGFHPATIDLTKLDVVIEEKESSASLVRGIARFLKDHGYQIGGFNLLSNSTIFPGAGVSSSAAFELLICEIFNQLYSNSSIDKMLLCKAGQWAENNYFGKKSGLLDQIGVAYGNIVKIDFKDIENPIVEEINFPFKDLHFVIVNTGGSHAELSDMYSSIPNDMFNAAKKMGHQFLIEGNLDELEENKNRLTDSEYKRAIHFYKENERVKKAIEALRINDEQAFLSTINESRESSTKLLKNMMVDVYEGSPLEATDLAMKIMEGHGAAKINGGGFAGSIICEVPSNYLDSFMKIMKEKYGDSNVQEVFVRDVGPTRHDNL